MKHALRSWVSDAAIVAGVCLVAYGGSNFNGGGSAENWSMGWSQADRTPITIGAGLIAVGWVSRRRASHAG